MKTKAQCIIHITKTIIVFLRMKKYYNHLLIINL